MNGYNEVNFEKRGKLSDHVTCPVTGECQCVCNHCKPSKRLFLLSVFLFLLFLPSLSLAQTIDYKIKVLNNPIVDLNNHGAVITDDALILKSGKSQSLVCPGSDVQGLDNTVPNKLNDFQQVIGYCFQPGIGDVGFIRNRNGSYDFIHPLGSQATFLFGVNDLGHVVGQFFSNGNYHGFLWDRVSYTQIDFPAAGAQTVLFGINNDGVIAGAYFTRDATTQSEWEGFLRLPNGAFLPFDRAGADFAFPLDMNNDGLILGISDAPGGFQSGPSPEVSGNVFVNDDGVF